MLELIIVSHTLIPINTDTYLSILYKDTVQMCISTLVSDIEKSHMISFFILRDSKLASPLGGPLDVTE